MSNTIKLQLERLASDRWARRGVRVLLRATSLALALVCLGLGLHLIFGLPLAWPWIASLALGCVAIGALLVLRPRMPAQAVARRIDRHFDLYEQLSTALEIDPQSEGVGAYLHNQAQQNLAQLRGQIRSRQHFAWTDLGMLLALLLLLLGMLALTGLGPTLPEVVAEPLPALVAAPEANPPPAAAEPAALPPPPAEQSEVAEASNSAPGAASNLAALAEALRDQSVTRPAAEALDQGDVEGAANRLRELAEQAGNLSAQARADLAQALREAASQIAANDANLAEQVQQSAANIDAGNPNPAQGLEELAEAIEQAGAGQPTQAGTDQNGLAGSAGGGAGQSSLPGQQREGNRSRLEVEGVPLELKSEGPGTTPAQGAGEAETAQGGGTGAGGGFSRGSQSDERVAVDDDPLHIPADLRDVVQDYFSP